MEIIGNLLLNRYFQIKPTLLEKLNANFSNGFLIRIFCKEEFVDDSAAVFLDQPAKPLLSQISENIENYRILGSLSGKRVFLQIKKIFENTGPIPNDETVLKIPFEIKTASTKGILALTEKNIKSIICILNTEKEGRNFDDSTLMSADKLKNLDKLIFQKLSAPPDNFSEIILSLSDRNIQNLLNHFLHKGIASTDMLASYIYNLGDRGKIMTDNLSKSVKQEVLEKIKKARLISTYRWADEVSYIINRNIFISARELEIPARELKILDFIRKTYEINILKNQLDKKGIEDWLFEFEKSGRIREVINNVNRKVLTEALSFSDVRMTSQLFSNMISGDGIKLLIEDIESTRIIPEDKRIISLIRFFRVIKDIYFTPFIAKLDFENEVLQSRLYGGAIDLFVDEIGFAKVVFALKKMPAEWIDNVMKGVIKNIYEDVISNKIHIKKYDDYRIKESRFQFLKALYILTDEEKI